MSTLHTVNKSPFTHTELQSCLVAASEGDSILLIENGVLAALAGTPWAEQLAAAGARGIALYALQDDLAARGLSADRCATITSLLDYAGFVRLSCQHQRIHSWY